MLSEESYHVALAAYLAAGVLAMLLLAWWLGRRWPNGWTALLVLLCGALLLTPAYPREGVETFAPALVVAAFQMLTSGVESAQHALRPLAFACGLAVVLALILRFTLLRPRRPAPAPAAGAEGGD
ncbi:hypothetical protein E4634_11145 [Mangrovimicrobium sediminis]|uniref:Uncharacterized protein n=1 Tax=Mangrovimicrobium sediminis TaxID=2562682 RepID=A0A4Z0M1K5_9GAMM|nr:hypothetical protein [Haliea sp. SAOS-164]TGD73573.1 hypothetical protein E4634_11145 [Haliea sp. SAOS-164]